MKDWLKDAHRFVSIVIVLGAIVLVSKASKLVIFTFTFVVSIVFKSGLVNG